MARTREIRLRDVPEELYEWLVSESERKGLTLRSMVVADWWGTKEGHHDGTKPGQDGTKEGQKRDKFVPPTEEEAGAWHREKGYHFDLTEWFAYYRTLGWRPKGSRGAMRDWKQAMVTWESKWKTSQPPPKPGKPDAAEMERIRAALAAQRRLT